MNSFNLMIDEYFPLILLTFFVGLAILAFWGARRSRAAVKQYHDASEGARADLDKRMERDFLLRFKMEHISGWQLLGGAFVFFLVMTLLKWAGA